MNKPFRERGHKVSDYDPCPIYPLRGVWARAESMWATDGLWIASEPFDQDEGHG